MLFKAEIIRLIIEGVGVICNLKVKVLQIQRVFMGIWSMYKIKSPVNVIHKTTILRFLWASLI